MVTTFHRTLGFETARLRDRVRNAWAGRFTAAVVVASNERRDHYLAENWVSPQKITCIPHGVDLLRFRADPTARAATRGALDVPEGTVLVGAAGHFGPVKGLDVAIQAFAHAVARQPEGTRLVVAGRGSPAEQAQLRALASKAPAGSVRFIGFQDQPERFFSGLDIFIHTPRAEAFGLVVAEAMAVGLPVVATQVGGLLDLVRPGETGLLVPADDPQQAAAALESLLRDRRERARLGARAAQFAAEEYGLELCASRHIQLYKRVVRSLA
jgi:glycosyltransferase involved in cell wall biosynthesis